jgi:hypothetical protein
MRGSRLCAVGTVQKTVKSNTKHKGKGLVCDVTKATATEAWPVHKELHHLNLSSTIASAKAYAYRGNPSLLSGNNPHGFFGTVRTKFGYLLTLNVGHITLALNLISKSQ